MIKKRIIRKAMDKMKSLLRTLKNRMANKLNCSDQNNSAVYFVYRCIRSGYRMLFANRIIPKLQNEINNIAAEGASIAHEKNTVIDEKIAVINEKDTAINAKNITINEKNTIIESLYAERDHEKKERVNLENIVFRDKRNILFYYGGAGNHGCEALFRAITNLCRLEAADTLLFSYRKQEDVQFGTDKLAAYIKLSRLHASELEEYRFLQGAVAFSIGGDNYCGYPYGTDKLAQYNKAFLSKGVKPALIGCSIEPEILEHEEVLCDLDSLGLIIARESITYDALIRKGITRNTHLIPDSAFTLDAVYMPLPKEFIEGNTIGLNFSSVINDSGDKSAISGNITNLIDYILNQTDFNIALIPHVVQDFNDDSAILQSLYAIYRESGRVCLIENQGCQALKGYIARCHIFVGARTHATIAAYSSCVPTLALGYSVKSRGIAKDIFGTEENYVVTVQGLKHNDEFKNAFIWICEHEEEIRTHLKDTMPGYIVRANELAQHIEKLRNEKALYMPLANHKECVGCGNCATICPTNAVTMVEDSAGFAIRNIDYTKCIHCDACKKVCIQSDTRPQHKPLTFVAAANKNETERLSSSSGGIFIELAKVVLAENGAVYGAAFDEKLVVRHVRAEDMDGLNRLKGSKYVESRLGDSFSLVKADLKQGKKVIFSGTPCQIKALRMYLGQEYEKLFLVDVICHGVPSPLAWEDRKAQAARREGSELIGMDFRNKKDGWVGFNSKYKFKNGKGLYIGHSKDEFMKLFLSNKILRESCYACPANNYRSGSDITLGDYWNGQCKHPAFDDDKGISAVLLYSEKGKTLFYSISGLQYEQADLNWLETYNHCLIKSVDKPVDRDRFIIYNMIPELQDDYVRGPLVSVVTSSYNGEQFLDRYFIKMAEQTYNNFEIIFVDDGSTDNTKAIVEKWQAEYAKTRPTVKITYIWQENGGIASGYETGVRNMNGEFFTWIDNDDFYAPDYILENIKLFLSNRNCNITLTNFAIGTMDEHGNYLIQTDIFTLNKVIGGNIFINAITEQNFAFARYMIRTSCFDKANPKRELFHSRAGQSWQILLPVLYENPVYTIEKVLFYYVIRQDSVSHNNVQSKEVLLKKYEAYEEILTQTIKTMHLPEEEELLQIVKEKYDKRSNQLLNES